MAVDDPGVRAHVEQRDARGGRLRVVIVILAFLADLAAHGGSARGRR